MEVVIATRNKDKFKEISKILKNSNIKTLSLDDFPGVPQVKEDGKTLVDNALKKALTIARFTRRLTVSDDSGLVVDALGGGPGVYSSRFAGKGATYKKNNEKLLKLLKDVPQAKRQAKFICCVAVAEPGKIIGIVDGIHRGFITFETKGRNGFGYDPLFVCPGLNKTFAQLSPSLKNRVSHRARAFRKAKKLILEYIRKHKSQK